MGGSGVLMPDVHVVIVGFNQFRVGLVGVDLALDQKSEPEIFSC